MTRRRVFMSPRDVDKDQLKLGALLRESQPAHSLPPRFQEEVWHRIELSRRTSASRLPGRWIERWVGLFQHPLVAGAGLAILLMSGVSWGLQEGAHRAREAGRLRYISAVDPFARKLL